MLSSNPSKASCTGIAVCNNRRIERHRVFKETVQHDKTSMGCFYSFKLHIVISHLGNIILNFKLTKDDVNDRNSVEELAAGLFGILTGNNGYLSADLTEQLAHQYLQLLTPRRWNMKKVEWTLFEKPLLQHRALTVNDKLKNLC